MCGGGRSMSGTHSQGAGWCDAKAGQSRQVPGRQLVRPPAVSVEGSVWPTAAGRPAGREGTTDEQTDRGAVSAADVAAVPEVLNMHCLNGSTWGPS